MTLRQNKRQPPEIEARGDSPTVGSVLSIIDDAAERRAFAQWLNGEPTQTLAETLGLSSLSLPEQRQEVKRFRERIVNHLRRRFSGRHSWRDATRVDDP
jgi:hypothetical protein